MAMLTHDLERTFRPSEAPRRLRAGTASAHLAMIKRFCLCALTILLAGGTACRGYRTQDRDLFLALQAWCRLNAIALLVERTQYRL
jgi:hypothetical protein